MKRIRLIWVGKTKDRFIREGIEKYLDLLGPYGGIEIVEIGEARHPDRERIKRIEGERILGRTTSFLLLDETGTEMGSHEFARFLGDRLDVSPPVDFVIGGAFGVSEDVRRAARSRLSLSRLTFTHQMARVILLEQIYRAFTILRGRTYHY